MNPPKPASVILDAGGELAEMVGIPIIGRGPLLPFHFPPPNLPPGMVPKAWDRLLPAVQGFRSATRLSEAVAQGAARRPPLLGSGGGQSFHRHQ